MLRPLLFGMLVSLLSPSLAPALAQEPPVVPQTVPAVETPMTYGDLLRTYRRLQPRVDSLNPGLIGAFQTGLVVDETLTRFGREVYDQFYQRWTAPEGAVAYTLLVQEQPLPGLSTLLTLRLDGEIIYQTRLQPGEEFLENVVQEALHITARRLSPTE